MQLVSLILIRWIVIYPLDSTIQRLNNRALDIRDLASVNSPTPRFSLRGGDGCSQTKEHLISDGEVIMIDLEGDFTLVVSSLRLS